MEGKGREGKVGMGTEVYIDYRFLFLCIFKDKTDPNLFVLIVLLPARFSRTVYSYVSLSIRRVVKRYDRM